MKTYLVPNESHVSLTEIDFEALQAKGYRYYIFDVDNTLVEFSGSEVRAELVGFFAELREKKLVRDICLVSNSFYGSRRRRRLEHIADQLHAHLVLAKGFHLKPHRLPFVRAMEKMKASPEETVVVGDQIFTDIKGGNRLGLYTIYVFPLGRDHWLTFYRRWRERRIRGRG